ncbi:Tudor/PWWP/MBT superfamily protein [Rhynchospora pubera]|uniref:Tudor/PWWP/MBT superfamily protein n=1 Tax=Rhynchospora pubera TaxID=906938 RepID=A0AAV8CDM6_9POAL|nr:Tudor/PWWP/MBT superfamily protein [Rhynchospora pubera]
MVEYNHPEDTLPYKYKVNDLVWGKVKSHPWWPGQIFDPSLASEAAVKIKKDDHFLVAYFGDNTFGWNEASSLKPYQMAFHQMEKQVGIEAFVRGVSSSLAEVSRRIELAVSCNCIDRKSLTEQLVDSAGIIDGTRLPDVDSSVILESFNVERLMEYVHEVAVYGSENVNRLELVLARAYLKSFDKFRGFPVAPEFGYGEEFGNDPDKFPEAEKSGTGKGKKKKDEEDENKQQSEATPKKRGRPKKDKHLQVNADDSDYDLQSGSERDNSSKKAKQVKVSGAEYNLSSESNSKPKKRGRPKKKTQAEIADDEYEPLAESNEIPKKRGRPKKKKQAEISDDEYDTMSESDEMPKKRGRPKLKKQAEISDDEYDPLSESDEMPKKRGRPKKKKHDEISDEEFESVSKSRSPSSKLKSPTKSDISTPRKRGRPKKSKGVGISDEEFDSQLKTQSTLSKSKTPTKSDTGKKRGRPRKDVAQAPTVPERLVEYPPCTDMLTELCLTAQNPQKSSSFTPTMQSLFTKYKDSLAPDTFKGKDLIEETGSATKSGRRVSIPKHIQDSYWTDVLVDTGSDKDEDPASTSGQKKKRGPYNKREKTSSKNSEADVSPAEEEPLASTDIIAESSDESGPTGLVLYFNKPDAIPVEKELNEIFGTYGLLREADTEIDKKLNRATVVFQRRADAEVAFSSAGKYSKFGPALLSYELNYSPGPPKVSPSDGDVVDNGDASTAEANNLVNNSEASTKDDTNLDVAPGEGKEEPAQVVAEADRPVEPSA